MMLEGNNIYIMFALFFVMQICTAEYFRRVHFGPLNKLKRSGVDASATITDKRDFKAKNGIGYKVSYKFTDLQGRTQTKENEVLGSSQNDLSVGGALPVKYLREKPEISAIADNLASRAFGFKIVIIACYVQAMLLPGIMYLVYMKNNGV